MNRAVEPTRRDDLLPSCAIKSCCNSILRFKASVVPTKCHASQHPRVQRDHHARHLPMTSTPGGKPGMFNLWQLPTLPPPALVAVTATTSSRVALYAWISLFHFPCYAVRVDRSSTRAASSPSPTRALSAPSTTRRYFPPGRRISSCRPRRATLAQNSLPDDLHPRLRFHELLQRENFRLINRRYHHRVRRKRCFIIHVIIFGRRAFERERANSRQSTCCVTFPQPRFESTKSMRTKA